MTAGSDKEGSSQYGTNHHAIHPRDDRETLNALFDGELSGDATRFALKRLDHDAGWRETCGRWQLIGDALRGEAIIVAPAGFATGVMRVLASEAQAVASVASSVSSASGFAQANAALRRRWIGGAALAASVAMAAMLVVRPFSQQTASVPDTQIAVSTSSAVSAPPAAPLTTVATPSNSAEPATALAVADAPRQRADRRGTGSPRAVPRLSRPQSAPIELPSSEPTTAVATVTPATTRQPFHPPVDEITTRPWPRAALPDAAATGALTVGFGNGSESSPSFYPFEPRLPVTEAQATDEPQR